MSRQTNLVPFSGNTNLDHISVYFAFENKLCHKTNHKTSWLFTSVRIWSVKFVISLHKGTLETLYTTKPDLIDATRFILGMSTFLECVWIVGFTL
jgi:hypothetical protein